MTRLIITILSVFLAISSPCICLSAEPDVNDSTDTDDSSIATTTTSVTDSTDANDSEPAISRDDAIKDAQSQLKEPGPVKDLTNPGVVYTELSEGVSAWISSLDGNRDQFGNEITDCYVTATRPDFVPASLQTFLLGYYKDNNDIGLAFGDEGIANATHTVQDAYNESVTDLAEKIIKEKEEEAANNEAALEEQAAENDQENANAAEDTPVLNDNDDQGGDATADNNNDGGAAGDDNGDDTNLSGAAAIEKKYKVDLQSDDKDFSEDELIVIDEALGFLPSGFYSPRQVNSGETENPTPTRIVRTSSMSYNGQTAFGCFESKPPAHISITNAAWDLSSNDYPTPPFTEEEGHAAQFGGTLVHEMLHRNLANDDNGNYLSDMADKPLVREWATSFGWSNNGGQWSVQDKSTCVTAYAGMVNPEEDMADSLMTYVYWPNKLKAINPDKYNFIKNTLGVAESGKSQPYPN